jgi:hypothetical protein
MVGREQDSGDVLSIPDVAERLMAEFGARVDLATITDVVLGCCRDLRGAPGAALPELVERLARQHLLDRASDSSDCGDANDPHHEVGGAARGGWAMPPAGEGRQPRA